MPIYQRSGVWYARAQLGGQRIECSAGKGATKAQAKELEQALFKRLHEDRHAKRVGKSLNRTFGEALLEYLKMPETQNLRSYESLLSVANLIRPYLETVALEDVPVKAEEMKQVFLAQGLANATVNRRLAMVRRILNLAHEKWRWINQPLYVELLPENNERHIYPTPREAYELAKTCTVRDNADALIVIYFTGMRRGEFMKVNRNPEKYIVGNDILLYSGHKGKRPGKVPIADEIRPIIDRMPLNVTFHTIRYHFEKGRELIGRPELHLHDFRHGFASLIADGGGSLLDINRLLRHSTMQMSSRYTHLTDRHLRKVVTKATKKARKTA